MAGNFLLCKSIAKTEMCHFLAPAGQPEMMHKNFMHRYLRIFVVRCSRMKFYYAEGSIMEKPEPIRPEERNTAARKGAAIHRASVGNRAEQHRLPQPEQRTERDIF